RWSATSGWSARRCWSFFISQPNTTTCCTAQLQLITKRCSPRVAFQRTAYSAISVIGSFFSSLGEEDKLSRLPSKEPGSCSCHRQLSPSLPIPVLPKFWQSLEPIQRPVWIRPSYGNG